MFFRVFVLAWEMQGCPGSEFSLFAFKLFFRILTVTVYRQSRHFNLDGTTWKL